MKTELKKDPFFKWVFVVFVVTALIGAFFCYRSLRNAQLIAKPVTGKVTSVMTKATSKTDSIHPFTRSELLHYRQAAFDHKVDQYPNGYLVIRRAGIRLPIYNRTNNYTVALGVVKSYFLDSQMGAGNYVLAGHNEAMPGVLLSNLYQVKIGDDMSVSNNKYIYHYRVGIKHRVDPLVKLFDGKAKRGSPFYLPDGDEKPLLTVYTCSDGGRDRLMVQGQLVSRQHK